MIGQGQVVTDTCGRSYVLGWEIGQGGQGVVHESTDLAANTQCTVKLHHPGVATPEAAARLDALVALNLSARSPALCAPYATLSPSYGCVGAVQPYAPGEPLEELLQSGTLRLLDAIGISLALCRALTVLERMGVGHGDLAASNCHVKFNGEFFEVFLIDFDNASVPGTSAPTFRGQDLYAAPELLSGVATVSVLTDRFALAVLLHELLLGRHPFTAAAQGPLDFATYVAMLSTASWQEDPVEGGAPGALPGLPVGVLPREIHRLFRAALGVDPFARPSARDWEQTLDHVLDELYECGACKQSFANDLARYECPYCGAPAEVLELHVNGRVIPLVSLTTIVGRDDMDGDLMVSREHAVVLRRGFALVVRCASPNGLAVHTAGFWHELAAGEEITAAPGDRIAFARGAEGVITPRPR